MQISYTSPSLEQSMVDTHELFARSAYTILYFYPKDNTPGCSVEAQWFNQLVDDFIALDVQIIGVSKDNHKSHCKFTEKFGLKFGLITDDELVLHQDPRFQTRVEKSMYGKNYMWSASHTFLLSSTGEVLHKRDKVNTKTHAQEVLEWVRSM